MTVAAACSVDFPGGVTVVWLGALRSADLVVAEVAAQVGLPRSGGQSYEDALTGWLSERDALLVIDNCEHVVSAVADLVAALTARLPHLRVLATSREPLWVDGEVTYRLGPLTVVGPDASLEEVTASARGSVVSGARRCARGGSARHAMRAGRLLGAMSGASTGSRSQSSSPPRAWPASILRTSRRTSTTCSPCSRSPHGAPTVRSVPLHATVEWSDALLGEEERRLFRRMGVFAGTFDLAAVKEVCASDGQTAARVADLTATARREVAPLEARRWRRVPTARTIRQYAVEQLAAAGELDGGSRASCALLPRRRPSGVRRDHDRERAAAPRRARTHRRQPARRARAPSADR